MIMRKKTGSTIRMMSAEGKSLRQIAEKTDLSIDEIEDYLISRGIRPTYTAKQGKIENREVKKRMENEKSGLVEVKDAAAENAKKKWYASCENPLTDEQKAEILHMYKSGVSMEKIAEKFGKTKSYLYKVCKRMSGGYDTPKYADETTAEKEVENMENKEVTLETAEPNKELVEMLKEAKEFIIKYACDADDKSTIFAAGVTCGKIDKALEGYES